MSLPRFYTSQYPELVAPIYRVCDKCGWLRIRLMTDNPDLWASHCHIPWQMEDGLLMQ